MDKSERDDARKLIEDWGLQFEDFVITSTNDQGDEVGIQLVTYSVTVQKDGVTRSYKGGHARAWVAEFNADLKQGVFG